MCNFTSLRGIAQEQTPFPLLNRSGEMRKKIIPMVKRIEKDFVLSDSSVNVYGMRLLTSGYDMAEFKKNPIGYYGHKKDDGILLKWDDVRLDGDRVIGKPVFNMEHPRAERTIKEIEEGFLNCASIGKLVILDADLEDNPADADDPILVVTKWYNKECSVVDNPGNRNAMKVELYDGEDNEINLSDIINSKIKLSKMKKITLELTPTLLGMLNLSDDKATAEAVAQGIEEMHKENGALTKAKEKAEADLSDEKGKAVTSRVKSILDKGLEDKKFTKATRDKLEKTYATMPNELEDLVKDMTGFQSITDQISKTKAKKDVKDLADKTWDELDLADELAELKENDLDAWKEKFRAKYQKEPKA